MEGLVGLDIDMDAAEQGYTDQHDQHTDTDRKHEALGAGEVQTDVFEALGHGHQRDHEPGDEHVQRHVALGVQEGIIGVDDQLLHADEQTEGDDPGQHWRDHPTGDDGTNATPVHRIHRHADSSEANHGTDDGVCGRYRPATRRSHQQPGTRRQQRRHHAQHHEVGADHVGIDDAVLDRFGHLAASQIGTGEFEDHGDDDRLLDGQRA